MSVKKEYYEQILSYLPDTGVVLFDRDLKVQQVFDRYGVLEELFPNLYTARHIRMLEGPARKVSLLELCRRAIEKGEVLDVLYDTSQVRVRSINPKDSTEPLGLLIVIASREMITESRLDLQKEVDQAEASSETKSWFMASLSHEIRTPLNAIIGFVEQLQKTSLNKVQAEYLKIIDKSSTYLLDLVNEILTYSKLDSGKLQLDVVDFSLEVLVREIYQTMKVRADEKKINFRYRFDPSLGEIFRGDAFRIKQVIINLVSNAIKFTEYGYVHLTVDKVEGSNRQVQVCFSVDDSGVGIPENKMRDIFREYKQASSGVTRKHGGTGLGLTISKRLTEMMNGSIEVTSELGKGSTFTVQLPLEKSSLTTLSSEPQEVQQTAFDGYSALIVDDDAMNRILGKIILESFRMEVQLATDGKEALEILKKNTFDIVLLDIHMPEMGGLEVGRYIRSREEHREMKILIVTAEMIGEEWEEYKKQGMDGYLIKPYREINLMNRISRLLDLDSGDRAVRPVKVSLKEFDTDGLYDLSELEAVTGDNMEFFREMIETFIQNATEGMDQIQEAYTGKDWNSLRETAHRLIPSFKHLGVKTVVSNLIELKSRLDQFEDSEPAVDENQLNILVKQVRSDTRSVAEMLNEHLNTAK